MLLEAKRYGKTQRCGEAADGREDAPVRIDNSVVAGHEQGRTRGCGILLDYDCAGHT